MFVFFGFAQLRMNVNLKVPVTTIEHYFFSPPMDSWWSRKINDQTKKHTEKTAYLEPSV